MKKKILAVVMACTMCCALAACGSSDSGSAATSSAAADTTAAADTSAADTASTGDAADSSAKNFADLELGTDGTDITASLHVLTNRTDLVDTAFKDYVADFNTMYPNITIEYEGMTNYADDITTRLSTGDWGDICMIPTTVQKKDLSSFFMSYAIKEICISVIIDIIHLKCHEPDVFYRCICAEYQRLRYGIRR